MRQAPLHVAPDGSFAFRVARLFALLLCFLVEGGWALLPRTALLGLAVMAASFLVIGRGGFDRRLTPLFAIPVVVLIVALCRENFDLLSAAARFLNFCVAIALLNAYLPPPHTQPTTISPLEKDLVFIMRLMAAQALLTFILGYVAPALFTDIDVGEYTYSSAYYVLNYHMMPGDTVIRPDGFFYERGVFQFFLNLYLYIALFRLKNPLQAALALAAVATTWSTTGLLLAFSLLSLFAAQTFKMTAANIFLFGAVALLVILPFSFYVLENFNTKFYGTESGSFLVRQSDLFAGFQVIMDSPLFGIGFDDSTITAAMNRYISYIPNIQIETLLDRTISNGVIRMGITIGVPLTVLHFWGLWRQTLFPNRVAIFLIVTASLMSESIPYNPFLLAIMYSGLLLPMKSATQAPASGGGWLRPASARLERAQTR